MKTITNILMTPAHPMVDSFSEGGVYPVRALGVIVALLAIAALLG